MYQLQEENTKEHQKEQQHRIDSAGSHLYLWCRDGTVWRGGGGGKHDVLVFSFP